MGDVHNNAGSRKLEQEPLAKAGLREARRRGIPGGTLAKGSLRLAGGSEASRPCWDGGQAVGHMGRT